MYCTVLHGLWVGEGGYGEEERRVTVMWAVSESQENKKTPLLYTAVLSSHYTEQNDPYHFVFSTET